MSHARLFRCIVRNPRVRGGEPIVRGTRISVSSVVLEAREYGAPDGVFRAHPQLPLADVRVALAAWGRIGPELCTALKAVARRRAEAGDFFGFIGFASLIARRHG